MDACMLCPRMCGVDRESGEKGYCGMDGKLRAARAALHMWEEPCISGTRGSGAVFFSGCSLRCIFCQNYEIAQGNCAREISGICSGDEWSEGSGLSDTYPRDPEGQ